MMALRTASLVGALGLTLCGPPAMATGKPVLTENIDEPGRNSYQEGLLTSCGYAGDCVLIFATVPASTRRVVDHISCYVTTTAATSLPFVSLGSQSFRNARSFVALAGDGSGSQFFNDADTRAIYDAGEVPRIDIFVNAANTSLMLCTLIGHDIALP